MHRTTTLFLVIASLAFSSTSNASIVYSGSSANSFGAFDGNIAANDLINIGQSSLLSAASTVGANEGSLDGTHDGTGGQSGTNNAWYAGGSTVTFALNLNAGTGGSPEGYTISGVNSFAGWPNNDTFSNQVYLLQVATLLNPSFTTIESVNYQPFTNINNFPNDPSSTEVSITSTSGPLATGVTAVQFVLGIPTIPGAASGTVWQELDVIGRATPEPSSIVLWGVVIAGGLLVARRRNA